MVERQRGRWGISPSIILLLTGLACGRVGFDAQSEGVPCAGPRSQDIALLAFDDDVGSEFRDSVGDHHGYVAEGEVLLVPGREDCGQAILFGSSGQSAVYISDHPDWQLTEGAIELWIRPLGFAQTVLSRDANRRETDGHIELSLTAEGRVVLRLQELRGSPLEGFVCSKQTISRGEWHHIGIVFGDFDPVLWVDGLRADFLGAAAFAGMTITCNGIGGRGIDGNNNFWILGATNAASPEGELTSLTQFYHGEIDDLRISQEPGFLGL
jgi:hypothetical protein